MEEKNQTEQVETTTTKKKKAWIVIVVGVVLLAIGGTSYFQNETINNVFVEIGANQVTTGVIEMQPDSREAFLKAADVIDASIKARKTDPTILAALIEEAVKPYTGNIDVTPIIVTVINQINDVYKVSETEDKYIEKLKKVAAGIRSAASNSTV